MPWKIDEAVKRYYDEYRDGDGGAPTPGQRAFRDHETWTHFQWLTSSYTDDPRPFAPRYLFRGQSNHTLKLEPTLLRYLGPGVSPADAISAEKRVLSEFRRQRHLYWDNEPFFGVGQPWESWLLMQHYGAPTRLLDWTASLWVAVYFAVESNPETDGAVFIIDRTQLTGAAKRRIVAVGGTEKDLDEAVNDALIETAMNENAEPWVCPILASRWSERMAAQQGWFTVCANVCGDQHKIIGDSCGTAIAVIIPKEVKPQFLAELRTMNVTARSLFPGPDGFGRSLKEATIMHGFMERRTREELARLTGGEKADPLVQP